MTAAELEEFQQTVLGYYTAHGRHDLPWRLPETNGNFDPYKILVSEIMLQQTQVDRVIPKYHSFLARFPDIPSLAQASLGEVLTAWSGLGYNRRAKFLWQSARTIVDGCDSAFPRSIPELVTLPGVGKNTAGAILAYAFNRPAVFIETNVRTVFIHHFFRGEINIADSKVVNLVEQTLDNTSPRIWYWALMDYGAHLKQSVGNLNKLSKTYTRQTPFPGSLRQIRGQVIRLLAVGPRSLADLESTIIDRRLNAVLNDLRREDMIRLKNSKYMLR